MIQEPAPSDLLFCFPEEPKKCGFLHVYLGALSHKSIFPQTSLQDYRTNWGGGWRDDGSAIKSITAHAEDPAPTWWLTTIYHSCSRGYSAFFWPLPASGMHVTGIHLSRESTHTQGIKINLIKCFTSFCYVFKKWNFLIVHWVWNLLMCKWKVVIPDLIPSLEPFLECPGSYQTQALVISGRSANTFRIKNILIIWIYARFSGHICTRFSKDLLCFQKSEESLCL